MDEGEHEEDDYYKCNFCNKNLPENWFKKCNECDSFVSPHKNKMICKKCIDNYFRKSKRCIIVRHGYGEKIDGVYINFHYYCNKQCYKYKKAEIKEHDEIVKINQNRNRKRKSNDWFSFTIVKSKTN